MSHTKQVELLKQHVLEERDGEGIVHSVTNHPGAVIELPVDVADALIATGGAKDLEFEDSPLEKTDTPPADSSTAQPEEAAASSGPGASSTESEEQ